MPGLPGYCPHCGTLFIGRQIMVDNLWECTLTDIHENCPNCGRRADILDGVYNVYGNTIELVSGPQFTRDALKTLAELIERAARQEITEDELQEAATAIDPQLGQAVAQIRRQTKWPIAVLILLMLTLQRCNFNVNVDLDINRLWDQWSTQSEQSELYVPPESKRNGQNPKQHKARPNSNPAGRSPDEKRPRVGHPESPIEIDDPNPSRQVRRRLELLRRKRQRSESGPRKGR
jgi:hypothetical protein